MSENDSGDEEDDGSVSAEGAGRNRGNDGDEAQHNDGGAGQGDTRRKHAKVQSRRETDGSGSGKDHVADEGVHGGKRAQRVSSAAQHEKREKV